LPSGYQIENDSRRQPYQAAKYDKNQKVVVQFGKKALFPGGKGKALV
jgi:hypothetical protein